MYCHTLHPICDYMYWSWNIRFRRTLWDLWSFSPFFITFMALGPGPLYSHIKKLNEFFYRHSKCEAFASFASIALRSCLYMHPAARSLHIYPGIKRNWLFWQSSICINLFLKHMEFWGGAIHFAISHPSIPLQMIPTKSGMTCCSYEKSNTVYYDIMSSQKLSSTAMKLVRHKHDQDEKRRKS